MTTINLLPWREALRKEKQQQFFVALGASVAVMLLIVGGVHIQIQSMIEVQNARNSFLQAQIDRVERQIVEIDALEKEKQSLLARMEVIQNLQEGRSQMVHIFDQIARAVPEGVYVTKIEQKEGVINLLGMAQSNARVSSLMRNLETSEWFKDPKLEEIVANKNEQGPRESQFKLMVALKGELKVTEPKPETKNDKNKAKAKQTAKKEAK